MYELQVKKGDTWYQVDFGKDKPAINIQRNDIAELKDRQADYSQALKLPKTPNNCQIFDFINEFTSVSDIRHKRMPCQLYFDSFLIAKRGSVLKIVSVTDFFNVQILGSEVDFFQKLQGLNDKGEVKTINDLGFTENITRGRDGILQSDPTNNVPYRDSFYGITDFSEEPSGNGSLNRLFGFMSSSGQIPFVKYRSIISKILEENGGYTFESDMKNDFQYTNACIPFGSLKIYSEYLKNYGTNSLNSFGAFNNPTKEVIWSFSNYQSALVVAIRNGFTIQSYPVFNNSGTLIYNDILTFTVPASGKYSFHYTMYSYGFNGARLRMNNSIYKNAYDFTTTVGRGTIIGLWGDNTFENTSNINEYFTVDLVQGDKLQFRNNIILNDAGTFNSQNFSFNVTAFVPSDTDVAPNGIPMNIKGNLPVFTQLDFFKSFLQLYGLTINIDEDSKTIKAYTFNKIATNKSIAKDWSKKYNIRTGTQKFIIGNYAKNNLLKYKESETDKSTDVYTQISEGFAKYIHDNGGVIYYTTILVPTTKIKLNPNESFPAYEANYFIYNADYEKLLYEDIGVLVINDDNLKDETLLFELPFIATVNCRTPQFGNVNYAKIPIYKDDGSFSFKGTNLLLYGGQGTPVVDLLYSSNLSLIWSEDGFNGISITAQALIDKYYKTLKDNILNDIRVIEDAEFFLLPQDIQDFDPFVPVWVDYFGAYFYVNKIKNFVAGKITKVDLVRIN